MLLFDPDKRFYKGNLHTHTTVTDGRKPPEEVTALYAARGYDFLALTDHWRIAAEPHFDKNMLVLSGLELDYSLPAQVIHIVGIGAAPSVLERAKKWHSAQRGIDDILACGGRAILAHPAWSLNTPETIGALRGLSAAEIYNSVSGAPWNGDRADSTGILDVAAAQGAVLRTVAADDSHFYTGEECMSFIRAQLDSLSPEGVLKALDTGAYYASQGPAFTQIEVTPERIEISCSPVNRVLFLSDGVYAEERCQDGEGLTRAVYPIKKERREHFVRCRIIDAQGKSAWCNPILL